MHDLFHFSVVFFDGYLQYIFLDMDTTISFNRVIDAVSSVTVPFSEDVGMDVLMDYIGDARYVLLGEASHGTHEYYTWRAKISQRLIEEKGFSFIAVEGDWPDCYRLNRYIKHYTDAGHNAYEVLHAFNRWPTWMWANWEIVAFAEWLKKYNYERKPDQKVGFYGLDVYSLWESMEAIVSYLKVNDPKTLQAAVRTLRCLEPYRANEGQTYASASRLVPELCESEVVNLLREIQGNMLHYNTDHENVFSTAQNAHVAVNAERYYRAMVRGGASSWNIRDKHMVSTLNRLMDFHGKGAKTIVWEHNTHIGDARATDMAKQGMVNVGQLIADQHAKHEVVTVGFGSYQGSVIAGREWGDEMRKMTVPPAINGSWENMLHHLDSSKNKIIMLDKIKDEPLLKEPIGHRAIGVVYHPEFEQYGNYVQSVMTQRYGAFIFLDETTALHPLHITPDGHQIPDTFPFGF